MIARRGPGGRAMNGRSGVRVAWRHSYSLGVVAAGAGTLMILAACGQERDPNQPLTADQGAELLRDVRKDRSRLNELTPAEKAYLQRTLRK